MEEGVYLNSLVHVGSEKERRGVYLNSLVHVGSEKERDGGGGIPELPGSRGIREREEGGIPELPGSRGIRERERWRRGYT